MAVACEPCVPGREDLAVGRNAGATRLFHNVEAMGQEPVKLYGPVG
jgi:hypothetical protein